MLKIYSSLLVSLITFSSVYGIKKMQSACSFVMVIITRKRKKIKKALRAVYQVLCGLIDFLSQSNSKSVKVTILGVKRERAPEGVSNFLLPYTTLNKMASRQLLKKLTTRGYSTNRAIFLNAKQIQSLEAGSER